MILQVTPSSIIPSRGATFQGTTFFKRSGGAKQFPIKSFKADDISSVKLNNFEYLMEEQSESILSGWKSHGLQEPASLLSEKQEGQEQKVISTWRSLGVFLVENNKVGYVVLYVIILKKYDRYIIRFWSNVYLSLLTLCSFLKMIASLKMI